MSIQTEITLDITQFNKNLEIIAAEGRAVAAQITKSFKDVGNAATPKVDSSAINKMVDSFKAAKVQAGLFLTQQEDIRRAMKFNGQEGSEAFKTVEKNIKEARVELSKFEKAAEDGSVNIKKSFSSGIKESFKQGQAEIAGGGGILGSLAGTIGQLASPIGLATAAIGGLSAGLVTTIKLGSEFETALKQVGAITGQSGKGLGILGDNARDLAKKFGGDAVTQLESFKGVLSRFGTQLAKSPENLKILADNINILGKASGLDAAQSMDTLTNSMLQFGVDVKNPNEAAAQSTRFINALAKSAEVGAAEIPQIGEAILQAGVQARKSNVSFEETNAALQVLAAGGKVGSEAGVALRNVLGKLAGEEVIPDEALAKLKSLGVDMSLVTDTSKPLAVRLKELAKASKDGTAFTQVFGAENAAAASILADGSKQVALWTKEITGSSAATDQAAVNMNTFSERISRFKAFLSDVAIGAFMNISPEVNASLDKATKAIETIIKFIVENLPGAIAVLGEWWGLLSEIGELLYNAIAAPIKAITILFASNTKETTKSKSVFESLQSVIRTVAGWFGSLNDVMDDNIKKFKTAVAVVKDFLGIEKLKDGLSESRKSLGDLAEEAAKLKKRVGEPIATPDLIMGEIKTPDTGNAKKTFTDLADYIQGLKEKINVIEFNLQIAEQNDVIGKLEKQIKDVVNNNNLTNVAKIEITAEIETQKAILETERELTKLATANQKTIESIEKDFQSKKKGASKSDIIKAEKEKNRLISIETDKYYKEAFDLIENRENKIVGIKDKKSKEIIDITKNEANVLKDLQTENITNEKDRAYQKELESLKRKFQDEIVKYKDNNSIKLELFKKYQSDLEKLQAGLTLDPASEITGIKTFLEAFNSQLKVTNETATKGNEDELNKRKENLENSIQDMSFSYAGYVDEMKKLDEDRLASMRSTSLTTIELIANQTKALVNSLQLSITSYEKYAETQKTLDTDIAKKKIELENEKLKDKTNVIKIEGELNDLQNKSEESKYQLLSDIFGQTKTLFGEQTVAYKAMAIVEASISTYLAATKALASVPFPFNFVASGLIIAAGLANVAKIVGAESGVIGINKSYNKKAGKTDSIPMLVAPGESIVNRKNTSKYRNVLEQINNGTYNYQRIDSNAGRVTGVVNDYGKTNESQRQEILSLKSELNQLHNAINNMQSSKNSRLDLELTNTSLLKNKHIVLASNKYKRKELSRL